MREIYRLLRLRGETCSQAAMIAVGAVLFGVGAEARYHLITQRLDALSDED